MALTATTTDVAVIGLGAMGAATLYQLARRGIAAVGVDRFIPPHDQGSSHGDTRITRQAVGEGGAYAPLVLRSHAIWRALEAATGDSLLEACGGLILGPTRQASSHHGKTDFLKKTVAVAERFGIAHQVLDRAAIAARFPQFTGLADDDTACFEPGAGYLRPERCIAALLAEAQRHGAVCRTGTAVRAIAQDGDLVRLTLAGGALTCRRAVVAAGAWTAPLLGAPFDRLLRVTRQVLHWFATDDPALYAPGRCPVFIRMYGPNDEDYFYGFPSLDGHSIKVATEQYRHTTTADTVSRSVAAEEAAAMHRTHLAGRLLHVTDQAERSVACVYTGTPDADFLIDTHPAMNRVTVISACSGHGFKHAAAIGEAVAATLATGHADADLSPFRLGRFG